MMKFCGACGAELNGTDAFCGKCGASTGQPAATPRQAPGPPASPLPDQPVRFTPVYAAQAPVASTSSPILKIVLALVVLLAIGGVLLLGGIFYAARRASQKIHELASESSSFAGDSSGISQEDPCRFLSKEAVSNATGVTVIRTRAHGSGCAYIAQGDPAEMISKHLAMTRGMEGLANGQSTSTGTTQEVEVLSYSVLSGALQKAWVGKIFNNLGPASQGLSGVGDQAVVVGGGMMMVRKGDKTIQIVYTRCPCNTDAVKPLAQKLVSAM